MVRNGNSVRVLEIQNGIRKTDAVFAEILPCLFRVPGNRHVEGVHLYVRQVKQPDTSSLNAVGKSPPRGFSPVKKHRAQNGKRAGPARHVFTDQPVDMFSSSHSDRWSR